MRLFFLLILLAGGKLAAQTVWIAGAVEDSITHRPIPGVVVWVINDNAADTSHAIRYRTVTNAYGLFSIEMPHVTGNLLITHPQYRSKIVAVKAKDKPLVALSPPEPGGDMVKMAKAKARILENSNPYYGNNAIGTHSFYNETYGVLYENPFTKTWKQPSSTFAVDVDRAAYSNIRRFLKQKESVPPDAVRIEEMINYFHYQYTPPAGTQPLKIYSQYTDCPWAPDHRLLEIAISARVLDASALPPSNLVFLIDVSGSMGAPAKLSLLQAAFRILTNNLRPVDKVAIVAYAGKPGLILPSTPGDQKDKILNAIDNLKTGGSTAGEAAIKMAYRIAAEQYVANGNNRVILATDGDFNVGQSTDEEMEALISEQKESGVLLTCLGFGMKNYKDSKLQTLSRKGNGNFAYIDNLEEASKIFAHEFGSTLFTVARDVQATVSFNPDAVKSYRLIGYENKVLPTDSAIPKMYGGGIIGSGHCAVVMYEIVPAVGQSDSLASLQVKYRLPADTAICELTAGIGSNIQSFASASDDHRFAAAVALFGMILRQSAYLGDGNMAMVQQIAEKARGEDPGGYRQEFLKLLKLVSKRKK
jgi:Ca-activated chloride channel family protein